MDRYKEVQQKRKTERDAASLKRRPAAACKRPAAAKMSSIAKKWTGSGKPPCPKSANAPPVKYGKAVISCNFAKKSFRIRATNNTVDTDRGWGANKPTQKSWSAALSVAGKINK